MSLGFFIDHSTDTSDLDQILFNVPFVHFCLPETMNRRLEPNEMMLL